MRRARDVPEMNRLPLPNAASHLREPVTKQLREASEGFARSADLSWKISINADRP